MMAFVLIRKLNAKRRSPKSIMPTNTLSKPTRLLPKQQSVWKAGLLSEPCINHMFNNTFFVILSSTQTLNKVVQLQNWKTP